MAAPAYARGASGASGALRQEGFDGGRLQELLRAPAEGGEDLGAELLTALAEQAWDAVPGVVAD